MSPQGPKSTWRDQALAIIARGYPAVAPQLPDLVRWLQDSNWPGTREVTDFLIALGEPVIPHVREVLRGTDRTWQYCILATLLDRWPRRLVAALEPELRMLIWLSDGEEVDLAALRQLAKHRLGEQEQVRRAIARKRQTYRALLEELTDIEHYLDLSGAGGSEGV
jgi:hypothetical protein